MQRSGPDDVRRRAPSGTAEHWGGSFVRRCAEFYPARRGRLRFDTRAARIAWPWDEVHPQVGGRMLEPQPTSHLGVVMTQPPPSGSPGWGQPPSGGQGWGQPPGQQPPKKRRTLLYVVLGVVVLVVAIAALGALAGGDDEDPRKQEKTSTTESGPRGDVKITSCTVDSFTGWAKADLHIKNNTSKTSSYWINVEFVDTRGVLVDESAAGVTNLSRYQEADETAQGLKETQGPIKCRITDVTRWAS